MLQKPQAEELGKYSSSSSSSSSTAGEMMDDAPETQTTTS
jgi:hypothetical protein